MNRELQWTNELSSEHPLLIRKIARSLLCDPDEARQALCEVLKFLVLAADPEHGQLTPSHRVDLAWHEFILFTRAYGQFCSRAFDRMIHHDPGGEQADNVAQYQHTLRRYTAQFGPPPPKFWGTPESASASCGNCESI